MPMNTCCTRQTDCASCPRAADEVLAYKRIHRGRHLPATRFEQNNLIFLLEGELLVNSEEYPNTTLERNQVILQPIGSLIELLAITDVEYVVYRFTQLPVICHSRYEEILKWTEAPAACVPLTAIPKLRRLLDDLAESLEEPTPPCDNYLTLKCRELVYLLMCYYPKEQACTFFHPISSYTESFHYFVMRNYDKVKNVEEFARRGGYALSTFRKQFKEMYNMPVYEWVLAKKREGILNDLLYTKQRVTSICEHYGFDSLSHFAHFCKDAFGDTPRSLRQRAANGEKIVILNKEKDSSCHRPETH